MTDVHLHVDDEDGRYRAVAEVEVPGTPEEVWEVIATGPGIEAWFVPAEVEPREGGRFVTHHGSFGASEGVVTAWEPPHRLAYDEPDWQGDGTAVPPWNTEILVEARTGDTCVVRLSSGFLAGGEDWQDDIRGTFDGWRGALRNLRIYLTHFAGLPVTTLTVMHEVQEGQPLPDVRAAAGLGGVRRGDETRTAADAPALRGTVEEVGDDSVTLRTTEPSAGLVELATVEWGSTRMIVVRGTLYGADGPAVRDREQPAWEDWAAALAATAAEG
ncbi:SRPBCC family protein [Streptomyces genisteinicus]|uniref:SRPBCC domain-containing protein n=1 Tax=Streptomyces genisteinicus TaxID=2768068 RepID=A0A7H0I4S9_9ACTN|nr:SRPBCC domain-containing protein [Streptomyces genisteinicus]QNP67795.1 SRPBCC domain-containing protein [Streptomyces genisteinicus]